VGGLNRSGYGVAAKAGKGASWAVLSGLCYKSFIRPEIVAETAIKSTSHAQNAGSNRPFRMSIQETRMNSRFPTPISVVVYSYAPQHPAAASASRSRSPLWCGAGISGVTRVATTCLKITHARGTEIKAAKRGPTTIGAGTVRPIGARSRGKISRAGRGRL
jgi:hypothetical protein